MSLVNRQGVKDTRLEGEVAPEFSSYIVFPPYRVSTMGWNRCPASIGIGVQHAAEYALKVSFNQLRITCNSLTQGFSKPGQGAQHSSIFITSNLLSMEYSIEVTLRSGLIWASKDEQRF